MLSSEVLDAGGERSQVREGKLGCFPIVPPTTGREAGARNTFHNISDIFPSARKSSQLWFSHLDKITGCRGRGEALTGTIVTHSQAPGSQVGAT